MRPGKQPMPRSTLLLSIFIAYTFVVAISALPVLSSSSLQDTSLEEKRSAPTAQEANGEGPLHRDPHSPYIGPGPPPGTLNPSSRTDGGEQKRRLHKRGLFFSTTVRQDQSQRHKNIADAPAARARSSHHRPERWYDEVGDEIIDFEADEYDDKDHEVGEKYWSDENEEGVLGDDDESRLLIEPTFPSRDLFDDQDDGDGIFDGIGIAYDDDDNEDDDDSDLDVSYWYGYRRRHPSLQDSEERRRERESKLLAPVWAVKEWDKDLDMIVDGTMDELMDRVQDVDHGQGRAVEASKVASNSVSSMPTRAGWSSGWSLGGGSNRMRHKGKSSDSVASTSKAAPPSFWHMFSFLF